MFPALNFLSYNLRETKNASGLVRSMCSVWYIRKRGGGGGGRCLNPHRTNSDLPPSLTQEMRTCLRRLRSLGRLRTKPASEREKREGGGGGIERPCRRRRRRRRRVMVGKKKRLGFTIIFLGGSVCGMEI